MADYTDAQLWGAPSSGPGVQSGVTVVSAHPSTPAEIAAAEAQSGAPPSAPPPGAYTDAQLWGSNPAVVSAPQALRPDELLGFLQGFDRVKDNFAQWAGGGLDRTLDAIPGGATVDNAIGDLWRGMGGRTYAQQVAAEQQQVANAAAQGRKPGALGEIAGNAVATAPVFFATRNPLVAGGVSGALSTDHPDDPWAVAQDAGLGAVSGKVGDTAMAGLGRLISPQLRPAVQALLNEGIPLTPGQILGGVPHRIEDGLTHIPVVGDLIKNAQSASVKGFNRAAINRTLAPIGEALPAGTPVGREGIDYAAGRLGDAYNSLLPHLDLSLDQETANGLADALQGTKTLPAPQQAQFQSILSNTVFAPFADDGSISGEGMQGIDSKLGYLARSYGASPDPDQRGLADALWSVQDSLRDMVARQNPAYAADINGVRQGWANLVRVQGAAANAGAKEGVFTPAQLTGAVRSADSSARKNAFARGAALLQDLSDNAQGVLPSTVPDSGTALRGLLEAGVLGLGAHEAGVLNPGTIAGAGLLAAPYTKPGLAAARVLLAGGRPDWTNGVANALERYGRPFTGAGITAGAPQLLLSSPESFVGASQ